MSDRAYVLNCSLLMFNLLRASNVTGASSSLVFSAAVAGMLTGLLAAIPHALKVPPTVRACLEGVSRWINSLSSLACVSCRPKGRLPVQKLACSSRKNLRLYWRENLCVLAFIFKKSRSSTLAMKQNVSRPAPLGLALKGSFQGQGSVLPEATCKAASPPLPACKNAALTSPALFCRGRLV